MDGLYIPDAFSADECTRICAAARGGHATDARLVRGDRDHNLRRAELVWIDDLPAMEWVADRLVDVVRDANRHFQFDIQAMRESPQIASYTADRAGHFDWHSDIGDGTVAARRKLTVVVQLTDPDTYDGGDLELQPSAHVRQARRERGGATAFPSFILHRVTPVTSGERQSLTLWAHGPAFR